MLSTLGGMPLCWNLTTVWPGTTWSSFWTTQVHTHTHTHPGLEQHDHVSEQHTHTHTHTRTHTAWPVTLWSSFWTAHTIRSSIMTVCVCVSYTHTDWSYILDRQWQSFVFMLPHSCHFFKVSRVGIVPTLTVKRQKALLRKGGNREEIWSQRPTWLERKSRNQQCLKFMY